jgi:hypothetical protein
MQVSNGLPPARRLPLSPSRNAVAIHSSCLLTSEIVTDAKQGQCLPSSRKRSCAHKSPATGISSCRFFFLSGSERHGIKSGPSCALPGHRRRPPRRHCLRQGQVIPPPESCQRQGNCRTSLKRHLSLGAGQSYSLADSQPAFSSVGVRSGRESDVRSLSTAR